MATTLDTAIRISAEVKGGGNIDRVKRSLQDLSKSSQVSARQIDQLYLETQKLARSSNGSVNALNQQKAALESLRNSVNPTSRRFALLSQDIARVSASLKEADAAAAGFGLASALTTSTAAASAGMVSFGGFTASTQAVAAALSRMGVSGSQASEMLRSLQGDTSGTIVTTQKLNLALNQAFASTPEKATAQINTMRQALAQLKIGSEDYLNALVRVNEAEAVNQARSGRAAVIAANLAYSGPTMTSGYGSNERLPALPNTMAADMQRVSELTARVNNLDRATDEYRRSLQELEVVQRRLNARPERRGLGLREAAGGAAGVLAMGGGPMGAMGAVGGSLAASGGAAGLLAAGGITIAAGVGALAARVGVEAETAQVRLKALADQFGEYNEAQASAVRIAATLRISQIEAADGFSKLYAALRPTGITLQEVEDAFIGFTAAARASGATATESSAALLQLKQALGSGILQGDELRSIREQAPAVGQAIAREMGVTIGELKKLGSEGKITTDIVIRALARLRGEKLGQLQTQFNTSAQAMKDLQVATENFGVTVARIFGPTTVALIRGVTAALQYANELAQNPFERAKQMERGQRQIGPSLTSEQLQARVAATAERNAARARAAAAGQPRAASGATKAAKTAETAPQSNLNQLLIENLRLNTELGNVGKDRISQLNAEIELIPQILKLQLSVLNASVKGQDLQQSRINAITEARARSAELEQQLEGVNKEVAEIAEQATSLRVSTLSGLLPKESPLKEAIKQVKTELLEADKAAEDLLNRLSGLAGTNPASGAARAAIGNLRGDLATANPGEIASQRLVQGDVDALKQQITELQNAGRELSALDQLVLKYGEDWEQIDPKIRASLGALSEQKDKLEELNRVNERNKQLAEGVAGAIGGGLSSAMDLLIDGTEEWGNSLKEIASGVLKDIARQLVQTMVIAPIVKGITGAFGVPSFAGGGFTGSSARSGGLDGQGGFMAMLHPRESVIDHTRPGGMRGASTTNVVINVDASGTKASGDPGAGNALARDLANVVDARLLHHKRPGGLLA
jgi:tape measure domain-containing protein